MRGKVAKSLRRLTMDDKKVVNKQHYRWFKKIYKTMTLTEKTQ